MKTKLVFQPLAKVVFYLHVTLKKLISLRFWINFGSTCKNCLTLAYISFIFMYALLFISCTTKIEHSKINDETINTVNETKTKVESSNKQTDPIKKKKTIIDANDKITAITKKRKIIIKGKSKDSKDNKKVDNVPATKILLGIEQVKTYLDYFNGKRVGLITNATGIDKTGKSSVDILNENVNLVALFSPEHGIRGAVREGASVSNIIDKKTGLHVYSLYGNTKRPTKQMLDTIDVLCFDIQDVGARFYTYIYTMAYAMEACAKYNKEFVVFDRPNPIGGYVEGNILQSQFKSFIGYYPIVQRHGMTIGELALMFNKEFKINCKLKVLPMQNWNRNSFFNELSLMWIPTSPNIPKSKTALIYVGMGLFEGVNVSVGRGTTMPFEYIGAPYMNADKTAATLNELQLSGVFFYPAYFTPSLSVYKNQNCQGIQIIVTDEKTFQPVKTGVFMFETLHNMYPSQFKINNRHLLKSGINLLTGSDAFTKNNFNAIEFYKTIKHDTEIFKSLREKYLLYK